MKWFGGKQASNYEESSGGGRGMLMGGGILGLIGAVIYMFTGVDPGQILNQSGGSDQIVTQPGSSTDHGKQFARVIFEGTNIVWDSLFKTMGERYEQPILHVFENEVNAEGCGFASAATGPFYCPANSKVYLDISFFDELANKFGAPGEAASAYVIAHEVGHHVQNLMGTSSKMERARRQMSETEYNKLSVKLELQADYYAGVWAHHQALKQYNKIVFEPGDIDSALNAANQIGDDRLQQQYQGRVTPDSFTHGSSKQRMYWFKKGFESGDIREGDTFASVEE